MRRNVQLEWREYLSYDKGNWNRSPLTAYLETTKMFLLIQYKATLLSGKPGKLPIRIQKTIAANALEENQPLPREEFTRQTLSFMLVQLHLSIWIALG